jgi:osmotically inducible lipoprotein OsmB
MKSLKQIAVSASLVTLALGLSGCAGMSNQDRNTAIGAGAGAVVGGVLTGGSPVGTVGGGPASKLRGLQSKRPAGRGVFFGRVSARSWRRG